MAIYHCNVKIISRSQGRSATGAAAYRSGTKIVDERIGLVHDYTRKSGIDHTEIMTPQNAPSWMQDRSVLWNEVERVEKRKDSQVCREVEVALPLELSPSERCDLVKEFIDDEFVKHGMIADLAIHHAHDENPHAHILLTTREVSPDGFGNKNRDWNDKARLEKWRESWAEHANDALERAGHSERIDHRTLEAQGIERIPQIHVGPNVVKMHLRGIETDRGNQACAIDIKNEQIVALSQYKEAVEHERNLEIARHQDITGNRERSRNTCTVADDTRGSDDRAPESATERERAAPESVDRSTDQHSQSMGNSGQESQRRRTPADRQDERTNPRHTPLEVDDCHDLLTEFDHAYCGPVDRIIDLARPTNPDPKRDAVDRTTDRKLDRTYRAAKRHLKALDCDQYEIGIRNRDGKMQIRTWDQDQVLESVSWLKRENARGSDIFVRPAGEQNSGVVLIDDLDADKIKRMKSSGFAPAAVIETSPHNHQAWIRISQHEIKPSTATGISQTMAKEYGGDPNSADWRHFGRLAGFTNPKPEHRTPSGFSPWVLCRESSGEQAERGEAMVSYVTERVRHSEAEQSRQKRLESATEAPDRSKRGDPMQTYQVHLKRLSERFSDGFDTSRADFMICSAMAKQGFSKTQLTETLYKASPELPTRKAGHESDYCERTVDAAFASQPVQDHLNRHGRDIKRESDLDR